MNPMLLAFLGGIFRWALAFGGGYLVKLGIFTEGQVNEYVMAGAAALAVAVASLGWSLHEKYFSKKVLVVALTQPPGTTENQVKEIIKSGAVTPTVFTPPHTVPGVPDQT